LKGEREMETILVTYEFRNGKQFKVVYRCFGKKPMQVIQIQEISDEK